jgi:hypothetical protein
MFVCHTVPWLHVVRDDRLGYNQLTPWSRALLEELIVTQLLKTFPAFYTN